MTCWTCRSKQRLHETKQFFGANVGSCSTVQISKIIFSPFPKNPNCCGVTSQYLLFDWDSLSSICSRFGFALQNLKKLKNPRVLHGFLVVMLKWSRVRYLLSWGPDLEVLFALGFLGVLGEDDHFLSWGSQIPCVYHAMCNSLYDVMETVQKEDTNIFYLNKFKKHM